MVSGIEAPVRLIVRWGALATVYATVGVTDVFWLTDDHAFRDDHGGNWAALAFAGAGRAVFYGYDHEYSETVGADPAIDLLEGGPEWLPWTSLIEFAQKGQLGWCYWFDGQRWLRTASAATTDLLDGHDEVGAAVLNDQRAIEELVEALTDGEQRDTRPAPAPHVMNNAGATLLDEAGEARMDATRLRRFVGLGHRVTSEDLARGLAVASAAGLTPDSRSPLLRRPAKPGQPRPPAVDVG